ncbi:hypothetical protein [Dyadobacter sp. CY351]|uniref:hypothetical protein n=1 Tax=Dyadobacter sp. CY351 TaxID=2909337 RepID=UPI001F3BD34D|nr:hypothetical protein [Dyadobacter sp. CY351]MCF2518743.1 hypothetical protein [Dyadobacter sp. CY351]
MEEFHEIVFPSREELMAQLPDYQRETLIPILLESKDDPIEAIDKWLNSEPVTVAQFGGAGETRNFAHAIKEELRKFLCGDKAYKKERDALLKQGSSAQALTVASLTMAIAPVVGVAAPIVATVIVLLILSFGKITVGAWCAINK